MSQKIQYASTAVAVDSVLFTIEDGKLKVLLIKRNSQPYKGALALPGGFVLNGETTRQASLRVLEEKTGLKDHLYIEQLYTFDELRRDPRGRIVSVAYMGLAERGNLKFSLEGRAQTPTLHSTGALNKLAFDHAHIIQYAVRRLRAKLEYTNVAFSLLSRQFTLNQLQKTYEVVLDRKLDKRNFRKKFLSLGLIRPTKKMFSGARQRPARLYEPASRNLAELKKFF